VLVDLKMRDPRFREQAARVRARRARAGSAAPVAESEPMTGAPTVDPDLSDDAVLAAQLRRERALAAAASVPARPGKSGERRPAARGGRPTGKAARPSGKKRR
jgi:preprotein translocase subunit SecF